MSDYNPDRWLIVEIGDADPCYKILSSWYGGYVGADSWRFSSAIRFAYKVDEAFYTVTTDTVTTYNLRGCAYGASSLASSVLEGFFEGAATASIHIRELTEAEAIAKLETMKWAE